MVTNGLRYKKIPKHSLRDQFFYKPALYTLQQVHPKFEANINALPNTGQVYWASSLFSQIWDAPYFNHPKKTV